MGFIDDINNALAPANKAGNDFFNSMASGFGNMGNVPMPTHGYDPNVEASNPSGGGTADIGATQQTGSASPMPNPGYNPSASTANSSGANMAQQSPQSLNSSIINTMMNALATPAIDPKIMAQAFAGLNDPNSPNYIQHPDYLGLTKDAFSRMQGQVQNMQNQINGGYDQVGTDMGDLYKADQQAATLGNNNILQQIAQGQAAAQQGSAANNVNALANLKNSELATRAAVAQQGGMPQAQGDYMKTDPADVAASGMLANAQQQGANANAAALDRTNLNNQMAAALGNQGAIMHQQLENNRLGYNASVGKYMTDLTNQEAQREMDASKQNYQDAMSRIMAGYNMAKDSADLDIKKAAAYNGSHGLPAMLQAIGIANLDNSKAAQTLRGGGNVPPDQTALAAFPQFQKEYLAAMQNGMGVAPGSKATAGDLIKYGLNDGITDPAQQAQWAQFAQMAMSPKALTDGSPYDMMMSSFQGG